MLSCECIINRNDLAEFVRILANEATNGNWENNDLSSFLEAMAAWIEDMDGYYKNQQKPVPNQPSWKTIAEILKASTVYE